MSINELIQLDVTAPYHAVGMFDDGLGGTVGVNTSPAYRVRVIVRDEANDQLSLHIGPAEIMLSAEQAREIARHLLAAADIAQLD